MDCHEKGEKRKLPKLQLKEEEGEKENMETDTKAGGGLGSNRGGNYYLLEGRGEEELLHGRNL